MIKFLLWYGLLTLVGVLTLPLAFRLFPGLHDRGYAFGRTLGWLLWGYVYWLLGSFGVLQNDSGGLLLALGIVAGLSVYAGSQLSAADLRDWWRENGGSVIIVELLFLLAFGGWALIRAMNPDITATEKPMELAFLNSVIRSPGFPPQDPWLAGYAISYYYFGYVLVGMIAMLTGTSAGVAFNLGIAAIFALAAAGAYGIIYNLLRARGGSRSSALGGLLGPLYVLVVSNAEGLLDVLHARGLFWTRGPDGTLRSAFWEWLDLKDLVNPPPEPFSFEPARHLWWWRASRVVNDVSYTGAQQEVIDEFPFFSFLLADLHPHVLAIPFVLLAIGLAWNFFARRDQLSIRVRTVELPIGVEEFLLAAVVLGSLAFLNTWDFPIYVALFAAAVIFRDADAGGWHWGVVIRGLLTGLVLGIAGVVLYLPFYIGFSSQAGGILPNVLNPTRGAHLWVMFGTLLIPLALYFVHRARRDGLAFGAGLRWGFGVIVGLWALSLLIVGAIALSPNAAAEALQRLGAPDGAALLQEAFTRRFVGFGGWLTLGLLLSACAAILLRDAERPPARFTVLMAAVALLLVIGPEFVYLRDLFGTRMNTIFKFYYQAWILLGLAAAYASARILGAWSGVSGLAASLAVILAVLVGLVYPVKSLETRTDGFDISGLTLDGTLHGAYLSENDRAAVEWLQEAELGVLVEAVGGSYSSGGRIAAHSGQPNLLGWVFHQGQWRGGYEEVGSREGDIESIYVDPDWAATVELLERYGVTYIYLGRLERTTYRVNEAKFQRNLDVLFSQGEVVIYGYMPDGAAP